MPRLALGSACDQETKAIRLTVVCKAFAQEHDVAVEEGWVPAVALSDVLKGMRAVEDDVGRVAAVVPAGEAGVVGLERGLDRQPAAGFQ